MTYPKIKLMVCAALTLSPFSTLLARAADAHDVGVVAVAQDVRLQMPGQTKARAVSAMQNLPDGARLRVGAGGRAVVVLYADGSRFSLPAGSVAVFSAAGLKTEGAIAPKRLPNLKLQQAKVLRNSRIAYGRSASTIMRQGENIELQSLMFGATMEARPTFRWSAVSQAVSYKLQLLDDNDAPVFEREVSGTSLVYPPDAPILKPEIDYAWSVSTLAAGKNWTKEGTFRLLSPEKIAVAKSELAALETDEAGAVVEDDAILNGVLRAEILRKYDLLDDAAAIYQMLVEKNSGSVALHMAFSEILASQNRFDASRAHREIAEKLQKADG